MEAKSEVESAPVATTETTPEAPSTETEDKILSALKKVQEEVDEINTAVTTPQTSQDTPDAVLEETVGREPSPVVLEDAVVREASPAVSEDSVEDVSVPVVSASSGVQKESGTKTKRKEAKGIEHVLKALNSLESTEEKLAALCTKYTELLEEHRVMQNKSKQNQRKLTTITREKDQLQTEQSKMILAKSKLESLCRELQRHNKLIKDESVARAKEEEEKRKEVTAKFQATINDIQRQMNENYEKNNKLREENVELATKLKNLIEQYELREQHIEKVFKHKELEQQLVDAKLAQANLQFSEEKERNIKEKQMLLEQVGHSNTKIELMGAQEAQLRNQVALYTDKYEEFQQTLAKSNEVFQSFKTEMDKMTKKIKKLEKETTMWRSRWENSNKALLEMAEEKTRSDKEIFSLNSKVQKLESLCRALQEERKKLSGKGTKAAGATSSPAKVLAEPGSSNELKIEPTRTPPNTPDAGSRGSPVTVQPDTETQTSSDGSQSQPTTSHTNDQSQAVLQAESVSDQLEAVLKLKEEAEESEVTDQSEPTTQVEENDQSNLDKERETETVEK